MAVVDLSFPHSYAVDLRGRAREVHFPRAFEQIRGRPGEVEWVVGGEVAGREVLPPDSGFAVFVRPHGTDPWRGIFGSGVGGSRSATGVYSTPSADRVAIVSSGSGYWICVDDPDDWEEVRCMPVRSVNPVPEAGVIVFGDLTSLVAYGADGLKWETERLGSDDLEVERCQRSTMWERTPEHSDPRF